MKIPELKFGNLVSRLPIIQGGMAVRVSTSQLAAAVAEAGGIGLIGTSGMEINEQREEIRKAREKTDGIIGINVMVAVRNFTETLKLAVEEAVDLIVAGAGFSRDIFKYGKDANIPIVPIVSSKKLAVISEKLGASAVVVEGKEAGGHLGTDKPLDKILDSIVKAVKIPVIAAGGIKDGFDIAEILNKGASGVQMGSRFVATEESNVSSKFKQLYIDSGPEDIVLVESPVGLPGRAIKNKFVEQINDGSFPDASWCKHLCLKKCSRKYCIIEALIAAQQGDVENGLVFAGETASFIKEVLSVRELMSRLKEELHSRLIKL